jgi:hypothetical protein
LNSQCYYFLIFLKYFLTVLILTFKKLFQMDIIILKPKYVCHLLRGMQQGKGAIQLQVGTVLLKERRKKGT